MATFTDEEYADNARIATGYERFFSTLVPYSLDPAMGSLNSVVRFIDRTASLPMRDASFCVLDGAEKVRDTHFSETITPTEFLQAILEDSSISRKDTSLEELLNKAKAQTVTSGEAAMIYLSSKKVDDVRVVIALKGNECTIRYRIDPDEMYDSSKWEEVVAPNVFLAAGDVNYGHYHGDINIFAMTSIYKACVETGLVQDNGLLAELDSEKQDIGNSISKVSLPVVSMFSTPKIKGDVIEDIAKEVSASSLQSDQVKKMCLMATQSWVNPTFEYSENVPSTYMARQFEGPQHDVIGACVTLSCTLGINAARADGDEFMYPGLNVRPSERALQRSNPQFSFHDVDPLEREALPDQLFGHREEFPERGVTEGIDFGEHGAAVYMSGHCAYVRNDGDGVDVYDSGRHFFGDLDMYQRFTRQSLGSADFCEYVKVKTLTQERKDFISQCKRPFYDPAVQSRAREIFKLTIPSTRSEMQLKRSWLLAVSENGAIIGESFGCEADQVAAPFTSGTKAPMATGKMLREALESQDHGFICLHGETDKDRLLPVVIFKSGDNLFAVNLGEAFECTFESIESGLPDGNYLDSYGGNNMELMRQSLGRDLSRSSIDSPGTFMSTTVGLAAQEFDR